MYPVMLPGNVYDDNGFSSYRNPDGLFPERQGTPPDPIGSLYVRFLERLTDAWHALRRPADAGDESMDGDAVPAISSR